MLKLNLASNGGRVMRMRSIAACTLRLPPRFRRVTAAHVGTTSPPCRQRSMLCSKEKLPTGHLRLPKPWPEQALNRHRVRWKPLRKGWAKYRLRRSMLLGKPWRVRVQPMTLATRPHASRHWPTCGALLVSSLRTTLMTSTDCAAISLNASRRLELESTSQLGRLP